MRKSLHKASGMPVKNIRYTWPTQLAEDLELVGKYVNLHAGELTACLVTYALRQLVARWNEKAVQEQGVFIPELASLGQEYRKYALASILAEMEHITKRRT